MYICPLNAEWKCDASNKKKIRVYIIGCSEALVWGVGALTRPIFLSQTKRGEGKWWMASPVSCQGLLALCWMELRRQRHSPKSSQGFLRVFKSCSSYLKRNSGRRRRPQPPLLFPQGRELVYVDGIVTSCELVIKMFLPGLRLFSFSCPRDICF